MKILWLCNVIPNPVAEKMKINKSMEGGWLTGALTSILDVNDIQIAVSFPQTFSKKIITDADGKLSYYGFPASKKTVGKYDLKLEKYFANIIEDFQPDIVHIWGTEFSHSLAIVKSFQNAEKTVCSIQGVCSAIALHYRSCLPTSVIYGASFRDILRMDNIWLTEKQFMRRGKIESQVIKGVGHIIGRTRFDKAWTKKINSEAKYYHCDETLRSIFYCKQNEWQYEKCEKHSIFVTAASCSIKGIHNVLRALPTVLSRFPDAKLYVIGQNPEKISRYRISKYYSYIQKLMNKLELRDKIVFVGRLEEEAICELFLKANVFVSASSIENSSNSIGEAMMLGMPIIASYVGGTMDMLLDQQEGLLYHDDAYYMLAEYICQIFEKRDLAKEFGQKAYEHAIDIYDRKKNVEQLCNIYHHIYESLKD